MSGPTTVIFTAEPATVILAAAAIRAAEAVRAGYQEAADLHERHSEASDKNRAAQSAASAAGQKALAEQVDRAEQRYQQLSQLAAPFGAMAALRASQPQRPVEQSLALIAAYAEQLQALIRQLEAALREATADSASQVETGITLDALSDAEASALPTAPSATASLRLLARLAALGPLPEHIEALSREIATAPTVDRKEMLELELRRAIQLFEEQAAREASALVLEQTLKDLGYQVEPVTDTLFIEGGVVHFSRPGWNDYQIRLRLNAKESTANFNVVRAVDAGNNERSVLDHIAEDRWCSEFPALLQALAARGLHLNVTRRLEAGELPVQLVDRNKLPRFAAAEERAQHDRPLQKEMK